jgi:hypothetical protein
MTIPLPIPELIEEWLLWVKWISNPDRDESQGQNFIGWDEFNWIATKHPNHAWQAILAVLKDPRAEPYLGVLAAGPLEDLLSSHGPEFITRIENEAKSNPKFSWLLGGVWQSDIPDNIWVRVQSVWDRTGWN